jgi:bifunctional lysine-specific demethylase and histidyl-hydroxylase NO66
MTAAPMAARTAELKVRPTAERRESPACMTAVPMAALTAEPMVALTVGPMAAPTVERTAERNSPIDPLLRLTGLAVDEFAARHWGIAPLLRTAEQRSGDGFGDLLSLDAVDELVSGRGLRTPFVRMSRGGDLLSPSRFTRSGGAGAEIGDQVADDKVLTEFAAGATLVLQGVHRTWAPVQSFSDELSAQLGHPVQVNAYVTPPQNTGFAPHYDVHDVFVLQFAGRKRWLVHEPVWPAPLRDQAWQQRKSAVDARASEAPLIDCVLEPGDVLYLPRGYIHSATSLDEISGHLTVGVHPVTRRMLADQILSGLSSDLELRRSLPMGVDLSNEDAIETDLAATIAALHAAIDRFDRPAITRALARHLATSTRPSAIRPFEQIDASRKLTSSDRVRLRPGLRLTVRVDGEHAVLRLPDREIRLPASQSEAARLATSGSTISAGELSGVESNDALALLSQLLRDGVVIPA